MGDFGARACAIVAVFAAAAADARADGLGVVAVARTSADRAGVQAAITSAVESGAGRPARIVSDAVTEARASVVAGAVPAATLERFRRVREEIDEGWRAFVRVEADFAASRLASARTEAEGLVALPGGAALYADASLRLGAVLGHLGRTEDAQSALVLALALDPDRPITLAEFSPDIVAAVDAARTLSRPTRALQLTTDPAGAALSIDGKDVGRAPLSIEVPLGQHVLVARLPQHESRALAIAVDASSPPTLALELTRDRAWTRLAEGPTLGLSGTGAQELADATVRYADVDEILVAAAVDRRGGPALLVQRCAGLPTRCTAVVDIGYADRSGLAAAAREAWHTVRAADLRYPLTVLADASETAPPGDDRCRWCRSPILWGSLGAAAFVGTIVIVALATSSHPPPVVGVSPGEF